MYLPVNFISHLRGSRGEEEEILKTEGGTKLILAQPNRKVIQPEKLTQGLFFGANARILARMIPYLTPELANYLDYLRKVGDLLINYTAASVYLLDNEHRYEVSENPDSRWNVIDPTLSLNILKKKDTLPQNSTTVSKVSSGAKSSSNSRRTLVICWQWNQVEGCSYIPNCRFQHVCNIQDCGGDHPAHKHILGILCVVIMNCLCLDGRLCLVKGHLLLMMDFVFQLNWPIM